MLNKLPDFLLIERLNIINEMIDIYRYPSNDTELISMETELQSRLPDTTQLYFGEPDDYPIILPIQLFDNEGYEIIEPIAYNGNEPIW